MLAFVTFLACGPSLLSTRSGAFAPPMQHSNFDAAFRTAGGNALMRSSGHWRCTPLRQRLDHGEMDAQLPGSAVHGEVDASSKARQLLKTLPLLIYIVVNWAGSAEILQIAQKSYPYPLMLTIVGACAPVAALPTLLAYDACRRVGLRRSLREIGAGLRTMFRGSIVFAALHLGVEFMWIGSLAGTSVGTNTAIYNTYLAFVCIGAMALGIERLTRQKVSGVALGLGGLALIWAGQGAARSGAVDTPWGVAMCLLSTLCFSAYQLACDVSGGEGVEEAKMEGPQLRSHLLWVGSLGLLSCTIVGATLATLALLGFPLPSAAVPSMKVINCMAAVVMLQMTYQLGLFAAIGATSALLVAGGSVTVIPTGYAFDYLLHGIVPSRTSMGACALIIAGFVVLVRASMAEQAQKAERAQPRPMLAAN